MKQAKIYVSGRLAGTLTNDETGYMFAYDAGYLRKKDAAPVSLTLPLRERPYYSTTLFPFFDGLIPEGWMLNVAEKAWKINRRNKMSLLLSCCKNCVGAVSIVPIKNEENHG